MSSNPPDLDSISELSNTYNANQTAVAVQQHENKSWYSDFKLLFSMMTDSSFKLQSTTMLSVGGALAYVVLPTDVVPDFIPLMGWVDDALVLKIVMDSAKGEINRFRHFKHK
ncbi:YkvA family protein [Sulfurimonas sp.]|uniref:YkvA family protein n=1 Tax=Sulfurimonas sp. TaxID=2022749 RepID=UPI002B4835D6|nr:YkvA family protein [Sulfurimonas sp.]